MFYVDALLGTGCKLNRPEPGAECGMVIIDGSVSVDGESMETGEWALLGDDAEILAETNARVVLLGGEAWPSVPRLEWNFVAFDEARLARAKEDWREGRFPLIPTDQRERIPLPGE